MLESAASGWFDVTYYFLDLEVSPQSTSLKGRVRIVGTCRQDSAQLLTLDLTNTMRIDSVIVNSRACAFIQNSFSFILTLDRWYHLGEAIAVDVWYGGHPVATGFGSFEFSSHSGVPWVYSLSEPFGARDWWPCKNDQYDKADSADIVITCDSIYKVGSQGSLVSVVNRGDGRSTYHWKEQYPIASYLISVDVTNFVEFSNWFHYTATDSMEVLNYVLPEHYADAVQSLPRAVDMLAIYSNLFGLYPFIKEKYGHAEFEGGGMEHQTMTSIGTFDENVIAHELAHQWFGDMITCRTWSDLWLNEGFAQYSTGLYREKKYGAASYRDYINLQMSIGVNAGGAIGAPDTSSSMTLFFSPLIYAKGASVLHMLRHVLGDSIFFRSLYAYANDPSLRYSTAATKDFERACETTSGKDLNYFFKEWIYGTGIPDYTYSWQWNSAGDSSAILITLEQSIVRSNPDFFTMPVDVRIIGGGKDTTVSLFNNARVQTFSVRFPAKPTSLLFDPDGWIMNLSFPSSLFPPTEYFLEQNYPNPFNGTTTIRYRIPNTTQVLLKIYDVLGREVVTLVNARQSPGIYDCRWSASSSTSGIYFYSLLAGGIYLQKKLVVLR